MRRSPEAEVDRLRKHLGCTIQSRILDVGCGREARLALALIKVFGKMDYLGIDVDELAVASSIKLLQGQGFPTYQFRFLDLYNTSCNPTGAQIADNFQFDIARSSIDIVYAYSLFSHVTKQDMVIYLNEFLRVLSPVGKVFLTLFIEDDVPAVSYNPKGYTRESRAPPLAFVRYNRSYFLTLLEQLGYSVFRITEPKEGKFTGMQRGIYLGRSGGKCK